MLDLPPIPTTSPPNAEVEDTVKCKLTSWTEDADIFGMQKYKEMKMHKGVDLVRAVCLDG